ncbi:hypothetical protein HPG69_016126 [Diceros bicornis minor]|uniref:BRWD/PHIP N-terminal domain-containing protein n=1 Tax=Diceros bicornis minor TaxID=77932 RepID=A0A7J7FHP1_DICBM|nr:hypothetical protein HPG69_016126 [Diceros bicornis minor]
MAEPSPARRPVPLIESELYFLIARYLSAGPCRRAAQVSARAGPAAAEVLVQELEQYQVCAAVSARPPRPLRVPRPPPEPARGRPAGPPSPSPPQRPHLAPAPRGGHSCAPRVFAAAAQEVGLGGQRAQQELRRIGETFDMSLPGFPSSRPPPPLRGSRSRGGGTSPLSGASPGPRASPGGFV